MHGAGSPTLPLGSSAHPMHPIPPRIRGDLVRSRQTTPEGQICIIKDPVTGAFYRLREAEGFIAEQLDGEISIEDICSRVEAKFGAELPEETLAAFIQSLDKSGLLETAYSKARTGKAGQPPKRLVGSVLYARIRLFNPHRLFDFLARHTGFFFTRRFLWLSSATIVASVLLTFLNWPDIAAGSASIYRFSTLPLVIATIFFTGSAHEMSHGLTCKHYGGEVRDMGFMLLYLQPALYCNVSDAWLFPEKSKRLWVGFAGPYFELFLGAVATILWRVTALDTWINHLALMVMGVSGIKTLVNFNPLIKLDGYYLLSDWLEVPNLRRRSFAWIGSLLKRAAGVLPRLPEISPRERRIFTLYGVLALGGSMAFFSIGALTIMDFLIENGQRLGLAGFIGLVVLRYRQYLMRLFGRRSGSSHFADGGRKPKPRLPRRQAVKLGAAAAALLLVCFGRMELRVSGAVNVLPYHNNDVRAQVAGIVSQVVVQEGQQLKKGDLVARLDDRELRNQLAQTQAILAQKRAALAQLVAGPTKSEIEVGRLAVATAKDTLAFAQQKLARSQALVQRGLIAPSAYDTDRAAATTAQDDLADAQGKLRVLLDGARPEQIAAARAEVSGLQEQQDYLQSQLQLVEVTSPSDGMVTTPTRQLDELIHQSIQKGGLIAKVYDVKLITMEVEVPETEIADVQVDQPVAVKTRAYPDRVFSGRVVEIGTTTDASPAANLAGTGPVAAAAPTGTKTTSNIRVITEIDNRDGLLKPGMTGYAKIDCGERSVGQLILRRLSRTVRVDLWSWW